MSNIVDFNDFKKQERLKIENIASEQYGVLKVNDDLYLSPNVMFISGGSEVKSLMESELKMKTTDILEEEAIAEINNIVTMREEKISITILEEKEDDVLVFNIFNTSNNKNLLLETPLIFSMEHIRIFVGVITSAIDMQDVSVTFFFKLSYEDLKETIEY